MLNQLKMCLTLVDRSTLWQATFLGVLITIGMLLEAISIGLIFPFVKIVAEPTLIHQMGWIKTIFGTVPSGGEQKFLIVVTICLFGVFVCKNILLLLIYFKQSRFVAINEALLAGRLFDRYLNGGYSLHLTRNSADLIRNITDAVAYIFTATFMGFITLASEGFFILSLAVVLFVAEPLLTFSAGLTLTATIGLFYVFFRHRHTAWGKQNQEIRGQLLLVLQQGLNNIKETKVLGRENFIIESFNKPRRELSRLKTILGTMKNAPRIWVETVMISGILLVILLILLSGGVTGDLFAGLALFAAAAFRLIPSMNRIIMAMNNVRGGTHAVKLVCEDLDVFQGNDTGGSENEGPPLTFSETLTVEGLCYHYPGSQELVLKDINLSIQRGESIGLIGASGAGKTTFADILLGLLEPSAGRVTVNGVDISTNMKSWRRHLGYVPQSIYLIDDTLRRNIAFGLADEEINEDMVLEAIRRAQLDDVVRGLPDGLDTPLNERGVRLSGGQRQRVGIARALYRDPAVIVFDEATSSLDSKTENEINKAIEQLHGDKTLIIIAHRLSTVRKCDRLVFFKDGRIADTGTFDELNARNEEFRRMVELSQL